MLQTGLRCLGYRDKIQVLRGQRHGRNGGDLHLRLSIFQGPKMLIHEIYLLSENLACTSLVVMTMYLIL